MSGLRHLRWRTTKNRTPGTVNFISVPVSYPIEGYGSQPPTKSYFFSEHFSVELIRKKPTRELYPLFTRCPSLLGKSRVRFQSPSTPIPREPFYLMYCEDDELVKVGIRTSTRAHPSHTTILTILSLLYRHVTWASSRQGLRPSPTTVSSKGIKIKWN